MGTSIPPGRNPTSGGLPCNGECPNKGVNDFFSFCYQLQQSSIYYSTLAMRQMMLGYQNQVGIGNCESSMLPGATNKIEGKSSVSVSDDSIPGALPLPLIGKQQNDFGHSSTGLFRTPTPHYKPDKAQQAPPVKVVISACETDSDDNEVASAGMMGSPRQRKVNFANPLSTIKIKSPTPIHSMEELYYFGHLEPGRTGFTSDSDLEGSETDVWCQYVWRIRNVERGQLQVPAGAAGGTKKRKKRRKKKNKTARSMGNEEDNGNDYLEQWHGNEGEGYYDEEDPNAIFEMPLNEDDYEFVSEIRRCGAVIENKDNADGVTNETGINAVGASGDDRINERIKDMKFLYGESGSVRILKMEDTIEHFFIEAGKKTNGRKY